MIDRVTTASKLWLVATASAAVFAALPGQAAAQAAADELIVTGTRLTTSGFTTPAPVTVLSADRLQQMGITNIAEALNELPQFRSDLKPTNQGFANFNLGANIVNLRGLGANRTLVLVDGKRFITSTREGTVDLNLIPTSLIARTEIVTGGASAAYGSDAIAGAVNIILDTNLTGYKFQVDGGTTQKGDGDKFHMSAAWGSGFAGDRGHIIMGGEYENQAKIGNCFTRDWCTTAGVALNPAGAAHDNSLPFNVLVTENYRYLNQTLGGVIPNIAANPAALRNMQFNAAGELVPYNPGVLQGGGFSVSPGDQPSSLNNANLLVPTKRYSTFGHVDYKLTDNIDAWVEGSYAWVSGRNTGSQANDSTINIKRDNAFAPASLKAFFAANPTVAKITIGRQAYDMNKLVGISEATTWRVAGGLKGDFTENWSWDISADYGQNHRDQYVENNRDQIKFFGPETNTLSNNFRGQGAVDAVVNPANGQIVCRSTIDPTDSTYNPNSGCKPVNLFGIGRASPESIDYFTDTNFTTLEFTQFDVQGAVQGELYRTWAGPIDVVAGADYRKNTIDFKNDAIGDAFNWYYNYGRSFAGTVGVTEVYGEGRIPLAKDMSFAKDLSVNLSGRKVWYKNTNDVTNSTTKLNAEAWKVGVVWDVNDWARFRFTRSRDIRAGNFFELYNTSLSTFGSTQNPWTRATDTPVTSGGGNPGIRPEKGDTWTVGAVFQPTWSWLQGFRASVDYYNIELKGAIGSLSITQIVTDCFNNGPTAQTCQKITFQNGYGTTMTAISNSNLNLATLKQRGLDIEVEYRTQLSRLFGEAAPGNVAFHVAATNNIEQSSRQDTFFLDRAGMTGQFPGFGQIGTPGLPKWEFAASQTYNVGRLSVTLQERFISSGLLNPAFIGPDDPGYSVTLTNSINDNTIPSRLYFNLSARYDIGERWGTKAQVFGSIVNLFDRAPPLAPGLISYTEPALFDQIGRQFRFGIRFQH